jgi:hypothetical protein
VTPSGLAATGLTESQLLHFTEHGWVLVESAIDPDLCRRCINAIDGIHARYTVGPSGYDSDRGYSWGYREPQMLDPTFFDTYTIPGFHEAVSQLVGHPKPRYLSSTAALHLPDPERTIDRASLLDRRSWGWHRDHRPKELIVTHETDPRLVNALMINAAMYFVPISPEDGVTAFLDGSHRYAGPDFASDLDVYEGVGEQFTTVQPTGAAGSIVFFCEALFHTATNVLSEQTRYTTFNWLGAPWFAREDNGRTPYWHDRFTNERLLSLFRSTRDE